MAVPEQPQPEEEQVVEVNFQLDSLGRTRLLAAPAGSELDAAAYDTRTHTTRLAVLGDGENDSAAAMPNAFELAQSEQESSNVYDDLLLDCEIADSGLLPRTFWISAVDAQATESGSVSHKGAHGSIRCHLEQLAADIFCFHTQHLRPNVNYDPSRSGAEWWVQIKPSPPQGRYAMHAGQKRPRTVDTVVCEDDLDSLGIPFHWDKDEDLRIAAGGSVYVHPHWSTVTYLATGETPSPTVCVEQCRVHPTTGSYHLHANDKPVRAYFSAPRIGKHLVFDGRFLHAATPELVPPLQSSFRTSVDPQHPHHRRLLRRGRRVTFLVNIWLNYRPLNVLAFPESLIDKLSRSSASSPTIKLLFPENEDPVQNIVVGDGAIVRDSNLETNTVDPCPDSRPVQPYTWPMGANDSGERIRMNLPTAMIHEAVRTGGNVSVQWKDTCPIQIGQWDETLSQFP
jgi:hypothetical protein